MINRLFLKNILSNYFIQRIIIVILRRTDCNLLNDLHSLFKFNFFYYLNYESNSYSLIINVNFNKILI